MKITLNNGVTVKFSKVVLSGSKKVVWGKSDCENFHLKAEIVLGSKNNILEEEAAYINHLNEMNCQTCVKLFLFSEIDGDKLRNIFEKDPESPIDLPTRQSFPIMVTESLEPMNPIFTPDLILAILEQKNLGVWNGDLTSDDIRADSVTGTIKLTDYDQAIMLNKTIRDLPNMEYLEWLNAYSKDRYGFFGQDTFYYNLNFSWERNVLPYFEGNVFDVSSTSYFIKDIKKHRTEKILHPFSTKDISAHGKFEQNERLRLLNTVKFKPGEKILDIGCNAGLLCHFLQDKGCHVRGIDIDPTLIIGTQILANIMGNRGPKFACQDLDDGEPIGELDTICLFSVLHQTLNIVENAKRIALSCKRLLIDCRLHENGMKLVGGKNVRATVWDHDTLESLIAYLESLFKGFHLTCNYGKTEQDRHLLEFTKT